MKRFEIRLPKKLHEKIRRESFETGKSMNEITVEMIENNYKEMLKNEKNAHRSN